MSGTFRGKSLLVPLVISGLGIMTVASAQTVGSPFAKKTKKQAWETEAPAPPPEDLIQTGPSIAAPASTPYSGAANVGVYQPQARNPLQESAQRQIQGSAYDYNPKPMNDISAYSGETLAGRAPSVASEPSAYYPGRDAGGQYQYQAPARGYNAPPTYQAGPPYSGPASGPYQQQPRKSWRDKLGLGGIKLAAQGFLKIGGAYVDRSSNDDQELEFAGHGRFEVEASAITDGGMEYGVNLELRGDYDRFRRGFGGLVGDCPPDAAGCSSTLVGTTPTGLRGHTSQFYTSGLSNATDTQIALESAHIFLRTAYGDITAGRDDGAAYLFSLGAPSLLMINASNSTVDYTGLDSVKTVNDASGFAEKITYTSPRLLGDQIGFGVQLGASYAPDARACGVNYCVRRNSDDPSGTLAPDLKDVLEVGLALDRKFDNGLKVEATASYATAKNDIALAGFDDLQAWNTGLEVTLGDWTAGGSYLQSNNALSDGDYTAWDAGITWKPSQLGVSASFGQAIDDNASLKSNQAVLGVTYEFDKFTLGTGVQYIERKTPFVVGGIREIRKEDAAALFIEGGFKF